MAEQSYSTQVLDHLGIVAGTCRQIGLIEMYQHHINRRYRQRAQMILLSEQSYTQKEIAQIVRVTPKTVAAFIKRYKKRGFLGL